MALNIPEFENGYRLLDIRRDSLNPVIKATKALDAKVEGLQKVVAVSMTHPYIDETTQRLYFKAGGSTDEYIDMKPLLDTMKHGIDLTTTSSSVEYDDISKIRFKDAILTKIGNLVEVDVGATIQGQVNASGTGKINYLRITGNTAGSSLDSSGTMTLNMPNNSIDAGINGTASQNVSAIHVIDNSGGSTVGGGTLNLRIPEPVKGSIGGGGDVTLKSIRFTGNTGSSTEGAGEMVIELPMMQGEVENNPTFEHITAVRVKGNVGDSKIENTVLTIDLPSGGGGGTGSDFDLKVGSRYSTPIDKVDTIIFDNSEVKIDTSRSNKKVLISSKGTPVEIETKDGTKSNGNAKLIKLTGDVETSEISDTGQLTINIPHHAGLSVSDGSIVSNGISTLEFADSTVVIDSSAAAKATITPKGISGKMNGAEGFVKEIEVVGNFGGSTFSNGKLKIDLPSSGGGTGPGSDITGVVGSQSAKIDRIEVIGDNTYNSSVAGTTLKIDIPRKPAIRGGSDQFSDIDIVEVANSTVTLDVAGGNRKALITPHIPFMGEGWFPTLEAMNAYIPEAARIPTKTYGYITNTLSGETSMWIWMPDLTGSGHPPSWIEMPISGSLSMIENNHRTRGILAVQRNAMTTIDGTGKLVITDTTVPEVICELRNQDGSTAKSGKFNEIYFEDGDGVVDFDTSSLELKVHRAQRREAMGKNPDTEVPRFLDDKYEGSLWLNKSDNSWWGYNSKDVTPGESRWTKVIHRGMSGDVANLTKRVPQVLPSLDVATETGDDKAWAESGWTHLPQNSMALPAETRHKTGGYVETFVISDTTVTGNYHRYQMLHVETDAATYKRYWLFDAKKWSDWVKTSFNPLELKAHNSDIHAHRISHPYYKASTFDCTYQEIKTAGYWLPISSMHLLGASDGKHKINDDQFSRVAYDGVYRVRGHLYFRGIPTTYTATDKGVWKIYIDKRKSGETNWVNIYQAQYIHDTTSMVYPPLSWDANDISLKSGDDIKIGFKFEPSTGTEATWLAKHPDIGFYGLRSFISIDEKDNDGGFAIGETHRKIHGRFAAIGNAEVKVFFDKTQNKVRVVDGTMATNITQMQP